MIQTSQGKVVSVHIMGRVKMWQDSGASFMGVISDCALFRKCSLQ